MEKDTPIHRVTFLEMSDEEQVKFIQQLRDRRQKPLSMFNEILQAKKEAKNIKLKTQFDKLKQALEKDFEQYDKKYEAIIKKINKLKEIQIEIDLEI